jgi:hypothetical protein
MKADLRTTADADEMVEQIDAWWQANRPAAPDLFLENRAGSEGSPKVGSPLHYAGPTISRRIPWAMSTQASS